jgi:hypothetical protein
MLQAMFHNSWRGRPKKSSHISYTYYISHIHITLQRYFVYIYTYNGLKKIFYGPSGRARAGPGRGQKIAGRAGPKFLGPCTGLGIMKIGQ